ncbi:Osmotically-inducible protein OsmY, contains BON domain [Humidesulfovibrio mexicanus]|uniref:Osmotically-inducible protein OsmY, contains BON domain n=1 Tax=Humidesulfovibrio mexicanus TaxID=147047 RepID=A0A238ZZT7_9BACT|nr:BON domain-containing protein [Humidesulfovibrio mexicanus]SNR88378.1 Osmotically-inducible protein OsmY, contains BON domain [Humidesulfovibrio mexicanus]
MNADSARSTRARRLARPAMLALLGLWLFCAGGCALVPFAITTTASFAMPQAASLAMSGVKSAYNGAVIASDERDMNTILRDNVLTLKAQSALAEAKAPDDVEALALNGDIFVVGTVASTEERGRIIAALQTVDGVDEVKGHLPLRDPDAVAPSGADTLLENRTRLALSRHLLHKNAGVAVEAVGGDLCLMGVVGSHAEALDLIQYVESMTGARAISLLAIRNEYASGRVETNGLYLLSPPTAAPLDAGPAGAAAQDSAHDADYLPLPDAPVVLQAAAPAVGQTLEHALRTAPVVAAATHVLPARPRIAPAHTHAAAPAVNKVRAHMQQKLITLAKREHNQLARAELLALADQVAQDRDVSISDRLSVAAEQATQTQSKAQIEKILELY